MDTAKLIIEAIGEDGVYDRVEKYTIDRLDAVYTFDPAAKAYLTERLSILNALGDNSEDTSTELNKGEQIVDDLDLGLITLIPFGTVIDEIRATVLFDFIVDDGVYSNREKKTLKYLRNNRHWTEGVQKSFEPSDFWLDSRPPVVVKEDKSHHQRLDVLDS